MKKPNFESSTVVKIIVGFGAGSEFKLVWGLSELLCFCIWRYLHSSLKNQFFIRRRMLTVY